MKRIYIYLMLILTSSTIISCEEEVTSDTEIATQTSNVTGNTTYSVSDNPYSYVGDQHNELLEASNWSGAGSYEEMFDNIYQASGSDITFDQEFLTSIGFDFEQNQLHLSNQSLEASGISESAKSFLIETYYNVEQIGLETEGDFDAIQSYYFQRQDYILSDNNQFSDADTAAILMALAVNIKSNEYWYANDIIGEIEIMSTTKRRKWNWWRTGVTDGVGALIGSVFGPVGAAVGGAVASAADALMQLSGGSTSVGFTYG